MEETTINSCFRTAVLQGIVCGALIGLHRFRNPTGKLFPLLSRMTTASNDVFQYRTTHSDSMAYCCKTVQYVCQYECIQSGTCSHISLAVGVSGYVGFVLRDMQERDRDATSPITSVTRVRTEGSGASGG